jgi:hypothetical protein
VSTLRRAATRRTPRYSTVSPEIHNTPVFLSGSSQGEADHVARDQTSQRRAVAARSSDDFKRRSLRCRQLRCRPWLKSARVPSQSFLAGNGGDDNVCRRKQRPPGGVEVVAVVVVGHEYRMDRREIGGCDRRSCQLAGFCAPAEVVLLAGTVERKNPLSLARDVHPRVAQRLLAGGRDA